MTAAVIAGHVGLSTSTVVSVLAGKGDRLRVRPETQRRVMDAARELGYRPSSGARALRTGRTGAIGLIQPFDHKRAYLPWQMLDGITAELDSDGTRLCLVRTPEGALESDDYLPSVIREFAVDGLLVNRIADIPAGLEESIARYRVPAVWINSKHDSDCVHPDDRGGARLAAEHLIGLGHERLAYASCFWFPGAPGHPGAVSPPAAPPHFSVADRYAGVADAADAAGISPPVAAVLGGDYATRSARTRALLEGTAAPTAVICYGHLEASAVHTAALEIGRRVPDDLSLVLFSENLNDQLGLELGVVSNRAEEMGREAVRCLRDKIARPDEPLPPRCLPLDFRPRRSCAPPPRRRS